MIYLKRLFQALILLTVILTAGIYIYLHQQTPSNEGPWQESQAFLAHSELDGSLVYIRNVRDFRYNPDGSAKSKLYLNKQYDLNQLERAWLVLSHFGPYGLAHSFVSFEFSNGDFLAVSIEARRRPGQRYSPLQGLFNRYTKIYILATEEDAIGLRSHISKERVLLYPMPPLKGETLQQFFLALLDETNQLHEQPDFYNTLADNCLTNLINKGDNLFDDLHFFDPRVILPGLVDQLTYREDITPNTETLAKTRQQAQINPDNIPLKQSVYSQLIRCNWSSDNKLRSGC